MRRRYHTYKTAELELMRQMVGEGLSYSQIAAHFNATKSAIGGALKRMRDVGDDTRVIRAWPAHIDFSPDNLNVRE